jgi:hypothetical protein
VCLRLVGALLVEINHEMIAAERRYIVASTRLHTAESLDFPPPTDPAVRVP